MPDPKKTLKDTVGAVNAVRKAAEQQAEKERKEKEKQATPQKG